MQEAFGIVLVVVVVLAAIVAVITVAGSGRAYDEIGHALNISADTVRTYIRRSMRKLEADTRTQAVATALRESFIT